MPDGHRFVAFGNRIRPDPPSLVGALLIRDPDVAAIAVPHPAVKRALNPLVDDATTKSQVRPKVLAMGVQHAETSVEASEGDQITTEVVQRHDVTDGQISAPRDLSASIAGSHPRLFLTNLSKISDLGALKIWRPTPRQCTSDKSQRWSQCQWVCAQHTARHRPVGRDAAAFTANAAGCQLTPASFSNSP